MLTNIDFGQGQVPWLHVAAQQQHSKHETIHLSAANGIPVASYQSLLENLTPFYTCNGIDSRGAWPEQALPCNTFTWLSHADDLIAAIELQHDKPVIGMGHSMGGTVTVLAANKRPDLFSKLIIIDPASLPFAALGPFYKRLPQRLSFKLFAFIRRTHNRQRLWPSTAAFIENYRHHPSYRQFTEQAFHDYVKYGLRERADGQFELLYHPHWESFNFRRVQDLWQALAQTTHPTLLLRAEHSYLYSQQQFDRRNRSLANNITAQTVPGTNHLLSHEAPRQLSEHLLKWLRA
jgi:pimeloyl-ACP methyl ester carboxylesterase